MSELPSLCKGFSPWPCRVVCRVYLAENKPCHAAETPLGPSSGRENPLLQRQLSIHLLYCCKSGAVGFNLIAEAVFLQSEITAATGGTLSSVS